MVEVEYRESAVDDIEAIVDYLSDRNIDAALRFRDAIFESVAMLRQYPGSGPKYPTKNQRLAELRKWRVNGFKNYLIFYLPHDDRIVIIRVLHGARDIGSILRDVG